MSAFIIKIIALFACLSILISSISFFNKKQTPVFEEPLITEKADFNEGEFNMKSFDIVVSEKGNDSNDGTLISPLRTIKAAKDKAKLLKNADVGTVTVWFREGTYCIDSTLKFDYQDLSDVIYRSYPYEKVIFTGAKEFSNWERTKVNGVDAFVTDANISSDAEYFNTLYNNNKRLSRPAFPKNGEYNVEKVNSDDNVHPDNTLFSLSTAFYAKKNDISNYKNPSDIDVRILHFWKDELLPVSSIDTDTGRIELAKLSSMTVNKNDRYLLENVFEALSLPGEWYLDRSDNKLYYIPQEGETVDNTKLYAGSIESLITVEKCCNIKFEGIDFKYTEWKTESGLFSLNPENIHNNPSFKNIQFLADFPQACYDAPACIMVSDSRGIDFANCSFCQIGASALKFGKRTVDSSVVSCLFDDIGGNAVYIDGNNNLNDESQQTLNIKVKDNHIRNYGMIFNNAVGILLTFAKNCDIANNEVHDGYYTAISVGWVWGYGDNITNNINIKNNLIYNIGQGWLSDMGGIYTLGVQPDTVISGNVVHNVGCYTGDNGYGGWGIYLDEGSSNMTVEKNLVYRCSSQGFHQHYGKDNIIRNNIFALNDEAQFKITKKEKHNSLYLYNNIFVSDNSPMYYGIAINEFKDSNNLFWDYKNKCNVYSGSSMKLVSRKSILDVKLAGYYKKAVFQDPMFKDVKNDDYNLAVNSPAFKAGFEALDYSLAGTITKFN